MKERKHAELIKAWADGAQIQYCHPHTNEWLNLDEPNWCSGIVYRIKPEPKPPIVVDKHVYFCDVRGVVYFVESSVPNKSFVPNIRFTFDPDAKLPIKVELI